MALEPRSHASTEHSGNGRHERDRDYKRGREELRGIRDEASTLIDDFRVLAQKEAELARAEMQEQVGFASRGAIAGGAAAILAALVLTFAFITLMFVLNEFMTLWAAAGVTTLTLLALTALSALLARTFLKRITVAPRQTLESLNEDVRWARDQMRFGAK